MIKFNINDTVKVKLTDMGKDIYYHQYDQFNLTPEYPEVDEIGYTKFQLWELMRLYGQCISMTGTVKNNTLPFHTEIIILKG